MAEYYKGSVRQVTPNTPMLNWRPAEKKLQDDMKFSSISEIDASLDTSRLHISIPLNGTEFYLVDDVSFQSSVGEYFIFNPNQEVRAEGFYKTNVEGICIFLSLERVEAIAQIENNSFDKILDAPFNFSWHPHEFAVKSFNLKENSFGHYLSNLVSTLLSKDMNLVIDLDDFYFKIADEFLKVHRQIGKHLNAIPATRNVTKQEIYNRLTKTYTYILDNYTNPISLNDLEKVTFLSKYHIVRLYRQIYGISPYQHILQLRIEKAKVLLKMNYSPTEVASQLSFSDRRAFTKTFKKMTGISPSGFQSK